MLFDFDSVSKFRNERVLVVDDEEFCLASMKAILFRAGIDIKLQTDFCITGREALDTIKSAYAHGFSYKIIFTDFNMPVMDGIQATKRIRAYFEQDLGLSKEQQPKIVGVTGHVLEKFTN